MDFVFDRTAKGRVINSLTVVDDANHAAVAILPERAIGEHSSTRILIASLCHVARPKPSAQITARSSVAALCRHGSIMWCAAIS